MKVKDLLSSPDKWTKHALARKSDGVSIGPFDRNAKSYCIRGAIFKCYSNSNYDLNEEVKQIEGRIKSRLIERGYYDHKNDCDTLVYWNNNPATRFEDIQEMVEALDI